VPDVLDLPLEYVGKAGKGAKSPATLEHLLLPMEKSDAA
jgi:hypothetical protein